MSIRAHDRNWRPSTCPFLLFQLRPTGSIYNGFAIRFFFSTKEHLPERLRPTIRLLQISIHDCVPRRQGTRPIHTNITNPRLWGAQIQAGLYAAIALACGSNGLLVVRRNHCTRAHNLADIRAYSIYRCRNLHPADPRIKWFL